MLAPRRLVRSGSTLDAKGEWVSRNLKTNAATIVCEAHSLALFAFFIREVSDRFVSPEMRAEHAKIISATAFGVALLSRSLGSLIFAHLHDDEKHLNDLASSLACSVVASVAVVYLPSYGTLGPLSTVLLFATQIALGLMIGASGSANRIVKTYKVIAADKRFLMVTLFQFQQVLGIALASFVDLLYESSYGGTTDIEDGSWRFVFLVTLPIALPGFFYLKGLHRAQQNQLQAKMLVPNQAPPAAAPAVAGTSEDSAPAPHTAALTELRAVPSLQRPAILFFGASALWPVGIWLLFAWAQARAPFQAFLAVCIFLVVGSLVAARIDSGHTPLAPQQIIIAGATVVAVTAPASFGILAVDASGEPAASPLVMAFWMLMTAFGLALYAGPLGAFLLMQLKASHGSILIVTWTLAQMIFAPTAAVIAIVLEQRWGTSAVGLYVSAVAVVSAVAISKLAPDAETATAIFSPTADQAASSAKTSIDVDSVPSQWSTVEAHPDDMRSPPSMPVAAAPAQNAEKHMV